MTLTTSITEFILINAYFYTKCISEYETSYKSVLCLFDNNKHIKIFDDVYNLYLAIYLLPRLISPITFSKLNISNKEYYNRYINYSLVKCYSNKENNKNNQKFINSILNVIQNNK